MHYTTHLEYARNNIDLCGTTSWGQIVAFDVFFFAAKSEMTDMS